MKHILSQVNLIKFWVILSILYCCIVTTIEFAGVPVSDTYSFAATGVQYAIVAICTSGLLLLLSSFRLIFAIFFPVLLLISGVMCFFTLTIGTHLTPVAIELALINDASMWWSMISTGLVITIIATLTAGIFVSLYRWKYVKATRRMSIISFTTGLIVTLTPIFFIPRITVPVVSRLPYSIYFSFQSYLNNKHEIQIERHTYDTTPVKAQTDTLNLIVVLGESLRADHLPFNGYPRSTMPKLSDYGNLISFDKLYTEATFTDVSIPYLLTDSDSDNPDNAYNEQSFISLLKKAGFETAWFANQDLSRSYTYFAHEADTLIYCNAGRSFYSYEPWLDSDMLPMIESWAGTTSAPKKAMIIHTIGSHWWYNSHYTPGQAAFKPEARHKDIGGIDKDELINSYDNTIVATDDFLSRLYDMYDKENTVMLYVSDHGEGLGEDGVFLHASDTEPLHYPACFMIYSPEYETKNPGLIQNLKANSNTQFTPDYIFHTVLDISGIETPVLNRKKSLANRY